MKKINYILLFILFNSSIITDRVTAVEVSNEYKMADSSVYSISIIDMDEMYELQFGEVAVLEKRIKNTGVRIVEIEHVYNLECGCSGGAIVKPKILNPGQVGLLKFTYNTFKKKLGLNIDNFAASTKSKQIVPIQGKIKVVVHKDIILQPQNIELGKVIKDDKPININVDLVSNRHIDMKNISIRPSSSNIKSRLALNKETIPAVNKNTSPEKHLLSISIDPNNIEEKINGFIEITIKDIRGKNAVFRINISGQVTPIIRAEPERIFLGYIQPANAIEKKIRIINAKKESIEIVNVEFPKDVQGSYDIVDNAKWKKDVMVKMRIPIIRTSVGKFEIIITAHDNNRKIYKMNLPCTYIGAITVKPTQKKGM